MDKMMDPDELQREHEEEMNYQYRAISKATVLSVVFTLLGLAYLLIPALIVFPLVAVGAGVIALANIKRFPEELTGRLPAKICVFLSLALLVGGTAMHVYIYLTEVPEGYQRISYRMLKDNKKTKLPYSEEALDLDGKKVFLKGYVRPGARKKDLKRFILVGDFGDCCFGGNPEITDVVAINIIGDETVDYSWSLRKIAGTFRLNKKTMKTDEKEVPRVFYQIEADIVK